MFLWEGDSPRAIVLLLTERKVFRVYCRSLFGVSVLSILRRATVLAMGLQLAPSAAPIPALPATPAACRNRRARNCAPLPGRLRHRCRSRSARTGAPCALCLRRCVPGVGLPRRCHRHVRIRRVVQHWLLQGWVCRSGYVFGHAREGGHRHYPCCGVH